MLCRADTVAAAVRPLMLMEDNRNPDLFVKVNGHQWPWHRDYLDQRIAFFNSLATDREAIAGRAPKGEHNLQEVGDPPVLAVGRKIRVLTTAKGPG